MYSLYFTIVTFTFFWSFTTSTSPTIICNPYEHYTCASPCQTECSTLGQTCPVTNICQHACFCDEGYARNSSGVCIPIEECSKDPGQYICDGPNEVYYYCGPRCQTTCENLGKRCTSGCEKTCFKGCYCKDGYARNEYGCCIPIEECPRFKCPGAGCCWWFSC